MTKSFNIFAVQHVWISYRQCLITLKQRKNLRRSPKCRTTNEFVELNSIM